jgi:hypothetical protein
MGQNLVPEPPAIITACTIVFLFKVQLSKASFLKKPGVISAQPFRVVRFLLS